MLCVTGAYIFSPIRIPLSEFCMGGASDPGLSRSATCFCAPGRNHDIADWISPTSVSDSMLSRRYRLYVTDTSACGAFSSRLCCTHRCECGSWISAFITLIRWRRTSCWSRVAAAASAGTAVWSLLATSIEKLPVALRFAASRLSTLMNRGLGASAFRAVSPGLSAALDPYFPWYTSSKP